MSLARFYVRLVLEAYSLLRVECLSTWHMTDEVDQDSPSSATDNAADHFRYASRIGMKPLL